MTREKVKSELANVPLIGKVLEDQGILSAAESKAVMAEIQRKSDLNKVDSSQPKPGFFGEEAMKMTRADGTALLTKAQLDKGLEGQAQAKAAAAVTDLEKIIAGKELDLPVWKKPHWGNGQGDNPVNAAINSPSRTDASSSAANIAELIVLLANKNPTDALKDDASKKSITDGVSAASKLAAYVSGDKNTTLSGDDVEKATKGLKLAAKANGMDENNATLNSYITNRFSEVQVGVTARTMEEAKEIADKAKKDTKSMDAALAASSSLASSVVADKGKK